MREGSSRPTRRRETFATGIQRGIGVCVSFVRGNLPSIRGTCSRPSSNRSGCCRYARASSRPRPSAGCSCIWSGGHVWRGHHANSPERCRFGAGSGDVVAGHRSGRGRARGDAPFLRFQTTNDCRPQWPCCQSGYRFAYRSTYRARLLQCDVHVRNVEWSRLGDLLPLAGMPVGAFIQTGERTALAYLQSL